MNNIASLEFNIVRQHNKKVLNYEFCKKISVLVWLTLSIGEISGTNIAEAGKLSSASDAF